MIEANLNLVVLISGGGTNLQSIIDKISSGTLNAKISAVISSCEDAFGLKRARDAEIPTVVISPNTFDSKIEYENHLITAVSSYKPGLVVLAGFMKILGKRFVTEFHDKIVNIHPSLLPKYKGLNTHQRALDAGDHVHGATVHYVTAELDDGPIILQAEVSVVSRDDAETLQKKVLREEHKLYPAAIQLIATGNVSFKTLSEST